MKLYLSRFLACLSFLISVHARVGESYNLSEDAEDCPVPDNVPLNVWPMVMSHDAATGYGISEGDDTVSHNIRSWAKSQTQGLNSQLEAGARAFDLRPLLHLDGRIIFHHGGIPTTLNITLQVVMEEVKAWSAQNVDELVLLKFSHYNNIEGGEVATALAAVGIPVTSPTTRLRTDDVYLCDIWSEALLPNGGHVIAHLEGISDWKINENFLNKPQFRLFFDGPMTDPISGMEHMYDKLSFTLDAVGRTERTPNYLEQTQAHWQTDAESIAAAMSVGECKSILGCETINGINKRIASTVTQLGYINLLELDNINDEGGMWTQQIHKELKKRQDILAAGFDCRTSYNPLSFNQWYFQREDSANNRLSSVIANSQLDHVVNCTIATLKDTINDTAPRNFRGVTQDICMMDSELGLLKLSSLLREYYMTPYTAPNNTVLPVGIKTTYGSGKEYVTGKKMNARFHLGKLYYNARCSFELTCVKKFKQKMHTTNLKPLMENLVLNL